MLLYFCGCLCTRRTNYLAVDRPKIILFHAWFQHKINLAKPRPWAELVAQAPAGGVARGNFRRLSAGYGRGCCEAITVRECSDWLQHCLMNIQLQLQLQQLFVLRPLQVDRGRIT